METLSKRLDVIPVHSATLISTIQPLLAVGVSVEMKAAVLLDVVRHTRYATTRI